MPLVAAIASFTTQGSTLIPVGVAPYNGSSRKRPASRASVASIDVGAHRIAYQKDRNTFQHRILVPVRAKRLPSLDSKSSWSRGQTTKSRMPVSISGDGPALCPATMPTDYTRRSALQAGTQRVRSVRPESAVRQRRRRRELRSSSFVRNCRNQRLPFNGTTSFVPRLQAQKC